jgi:hypothetical protein
VVAAEKYGRLFVLNANNLGGFTPSGPDNVLDFQWTDGQCWCAPSYFMGSDGIGRIVTSSGTTLITWWLWQHGSSTQLVWEGAGFIGPSIQDPGFFTSVSSNGANTASTGIIWAVGRPNGSTSTTDKVPLYAFAASPSNEVLQLLARLPAGSWPSSNNNAGILPVVANGKVYVASYQQLMIFGLNPTGSTALPDVVPTSVSYDSTKGVFSSEVMNQGSGATPAGVAIGVAYLLDGRWVNCGWALTTPLAPNASVTIGSQCIGDYVVPPGTHQIGVFVDDVNRFAESDKTNNLLSETITIPAAASSGALKSATATIGQPSVQAVPQSSATSSAIAAPEPNQVTGILLKKEGSKLTLQTRTGAEVAVDDTEARAQHLIPTLVVGAPFFALGTYDASGAFHAKVITRAKPSPASWFADK